jgi:anti-sigma factor RsiW
MERRRRNTGMTCAETQILLHALLDGELDAGHARDVEAHIAGCLGCASQLRQYRALHHAMSAVNLRFATPLSLRNRMSRAPWGQAA